MIRGRESTCGASHGARGFSRGAAAALCVKLGLKSERDLDVKLLRETLRSQGAFV